MEDRSITPGLKRRQSVAKLVTGIRGFDAMTKGGLPRGRCLLVAGGSGTGKTVMAGEFLLRGVLDHDQNGVFVTFEEHPDDIQRNLRGFGWDFDALVAKERVAFVDMSPTPGLTEVIANGDYDLAPIVARIRHAVEKVDAARVVIDSMGILFATFGDASKVRSTIQAVLDALKALDVTAMMTVETIGPDDRTPWAVEDFVSDAIVRLRLEQGEQRARRFMSIDKMRGADFHSGRVEYRIDRDGLAVFPRLDERRKAPRNRLDDRVATGVASLDELLGGGIPRGHSVLCSGNSGTGKTVLGCQFLEHGAAQGEKGLLVTLEEPLNQVLQCAKGFGWDLAGRRKRGELDCLVDSIIDLSPEQMLYQIVETVQQSGARRVVFDSLSAMRSESLDREDVRQFIAQLAQHLKGEGVTSLFTYLASDAFGSGTAQLLGRIDVNEMRLASLVDGIVLLRYTERDQQVRKVLNVLKMRGAAHARQIFNYEINGSGIEVGTRFAL